MFTDREAAFHEAIRATPDDDAPRLICADCLEESGDAVQTARAEFIRLQCALARLPDPTTYAPDLAQRASALFTAHCRKWNGAVHRRLQAGALRGQVKSRRAMIRSWQYERGFITDVTAHALAILQHPEEVARIGPLTTFRLWAVRHQVPALLAAPLLQSAQVIHLLDCDLSASEVGVVAVSPLAARIRLRVPPPNPPGALQPAATYAPVSPGLLARFRAWWSGGA